MAESLDKIIKIDGEDYKVNAESAEYVNHKLFINTESDSGETTTIASFDGNSDTVVNIVPQSGGSFKNTISVPSVPNPENLNVINFGDITSKVLDKLSNTSAAYSWNGNTLSAKNSTGDFSGIRVVVGDEVNFNSFKAFEDGPLSYLYFCKDSGNIYFGTKFSDDETYYQLATTAKTLATDNTLQVDLESNAAVKLKSTDNKNLDIGVKGTLPMSNGVFGVDISKVASTDTAEKSKASAVAKKMEYYINSAINETTSNFDKDTQIIVMRANTGENSGFCERRKTSYIWNYILSKFKEVFCKTGTEVISETKGCTGANSLKNVVVGRAANAGMSNGVQMWWVDPDLDDAEDYLRTNNFIYLSPATAAYDNGPTGNIKPGDIWIKYNPN